MSDKLKLICTACGSKDFEYPARPKPNDQVTCAGCGAASTYGELQAQAEKEAKKILDGIGKNIFR
ncbi:MULTISPECIES: hypothetical protein [unclassified Pseudoalteromonas]|uniref:ECs_2282 family putative zinc-binding protein n=1 Tax=unclassified Pseudoalteromonas TaxID=194690 RepID=UPI00046632A2|nr:MULTISPECIES: hypothetical protein [unclassified Pseudoalteromonas]